jgi:lipopolysaccharide export system protein LptA
MISGRLGGVIGFVLWTGVVSAQATPSARPTPCGFNAPGGLTMTEVAPGVHNSFAGGGVTIVCRDRNIRITADSAEQWAADNRYVLIGRVHYVETGRIDLTSNILTYTERDERIVASADSVRPVVATLPNGSVLRGPQVTLWREAPRINQRQRVWAVARPTITMIQTDSARKTADTVTVIANTVQMDGNDLMYAGGEVRITRTDILATGDSAFMNRATESMKLMGNPMIRGLGARKFTLNGSLIDATSRNRKLDRIISRGNAKTVSDDVTLTADTIDLRMANDLLEHAYAWGRSQRAVVQAPGHTMSADSLDVIMPRQRLRTVYALGSAFTESLADSIRFRTTEKDWMRGDTIVAVWDTLAATDTARSAPLKNITVWSKTPTARAYYNVAPADSTLRVPAISYVIGRRIVLDFANRKLNRVTVSDSVDGMYAEPKADSLKTVKPPTGRGGGPGDRDPHPPAFRPAGPPAFRPSGLPEFN